jgi:hypothetical protein
MILTAVLLVWTARSVYGSQLVSQAGLPGKSLFSRTSPVLVPDYNAALPGVNALLHPLLKITVEEIARQAPPPVYPLTSVWANNIKDGGGGLFTLQRSFNGYFWDTSGRIKNTPGTHGFADLAHTFGPATPHIYLGRENAKNNNEWKVGDDDITRMMYGASIDCKVTDAFHVIPVFTYYDWSNQPEVAAKPDLNKEWIGGLQLRFIF